MAVCTFFQSQGASRTVFRFNTPLVGLQVATCFAAGLVFRSAIGIAISLAFCTSAVALAGVLWVRRSNDGVAELSCTRPESAVNACGGITIQ
jgi:hypothetical protein